MTTKDFAETAIGTALISISALMSVRIGGVPLTLQTFMVFLLSLLLSRKKAFSAIVLYILAGTAGFPVFSGGTAGPAVLFGPTGGYIAGFLLFPFLPRNPLWYGAGIIADHLCGMLRFAAVAGMTFQESFSVTWFFLPVDFVKLAVAAAAAKELEKRMKNWRR